MRRTAVRVRIPPRVAGAGPKSRRLSQSGKAGGLTPLRRFKSVGRGACLVATPSLTPLSGAAIKKTACVYVTCVVELSA